MKLDLRKTNMLVDLVKVAVTILISLVFVTILIFLVSDDPANAINAFFLGPFTSVRRFSQIFQLATPILFTGLGVTIMLRAGLFNMGSEGAFYFGAIGATYVAINFHMPPGIHIIVSVLIAALCGGLVGVVPAVMKAKYGVNELVVSIMMNYVMVNVSMFILNYYLRDMNVSARISKDFLPTAMVPRLFGTAHAGIIVAVLLAVAVYFMLYRTKLGYNIRVTGINPSFAQYSGIGTMKVILLSQVIGCAVAGFGGGIEVLGSYKHFSWDSQTGYGFDGMVVAMIARRNPLTAVIAALFLGYLRAGADIMGRMSDVAPEVIQVVQAIMIVLVSAEAFLSGWRHKMTIRTTGPVAAEKEAV